jgi:hypothetical protein
MIRQKELIVMRAVAICYKAWLKPEEAMIYCNLGRSQLAKKCDEYGISKNANGYYKKTDLDLIVSAGPTKYQEALSKMRI